MSEALGPELSALTAVRLARASVAEYFAPLLAGSDEVTAVAACLTMIERKALGWPYYDAAVTLCGHPAVRNAAFEYFQANWLHGRASEVLAQDTEPEAVAEQALMTALLKADDAACAAAWRAFYLATGARPALVREYESAYAAAGPRAGLPIAVRNFVINPHDPANAFTLLELCVELRRSDLVLQIAAVLAEIDLHPRICGVFSAGAALNDNDPESARKRLQAAGSTRPAPAAIAIRLGRTAQRLNADILDAAGDYRKAYAAYEDLNKLADGNLPDVASLKRRMLEVAKTPIPALPVENRRQWLTMTGFPRSGTTLLENALAAHPQIETFEELPTRAAMQLYLDRELPSATHRERRIAVFEEARRRYYGEMERRRKKMPASVFLDKSPLRSADAGFMVKAFPDHRYIFSIRHPYDVVLSCFKHAFAPGMSMEVFRTFENAVGYYDFTMTQWFAAFGLADPRIHYLRYDDLVTDFEASLMGALGFLELEWNPAVLGFADAAKTRAGATPSYGKVRQGLAIGVQSSWKNYGFLFQSEAARPLRKWVEHFGYGTP